MNLMVLMYDEDGEGGVEESFDEEGAVKAHSTRGGTRDKGNDGNYMEALGFASTSIFERQCELRHQRITKEVW